MKASDWFPQRISHTMHIADPRLSVILIIEVVDLKANPLGVERSTPFAAQYQNQKLISAPRSVVAPVSLPGAAADTDMRCWSTEARQRKKRTSRADSKDTAMSTLALFLFLS